MQAPHLSLCLAVAATLAACAPPTRQPHVVASKIVDAIKADEVHWNLDWKNRNLDDIVGHYAPNAVLLTPDEPPAVGAAAIRAAFAQALQDPAYAFSFASERVTVAKSGDLAAARGTFSLTVTDPATKAPRTLSGTYVTTYAPAPDGGWKAVWNIGTPGPTLPTSAK